jgi:polyhydroxyalkanoate synthesis regulator phasin
MSDEKSKVTDKASEIAKNIWLAGVGAYGKAVEDAQGRLEKAMEPPKLFRELVKAGTALEDDAREALETAAAARSSVEERINRVRENFHMQRPARIEDLTALHKKVDRLTRKVDKLSKTLEEQGIVKGAGKPKTAATSNSSAGTSSTRATRKKPVARKKAAPRKKATTRTKSSARKSKA